MKDTLIKIKNNLQRNSRVNEAEYQINDLEHKEKTSRATRTKKNPKKKKKG